MPSRVQQVLIANVRDKIDLADVKSVAFAEDAYDVADRDPECQCDNPLAAAAL